jgi:hypothetical protein
VLQAATANIDAIANNANTFFMVCVFLFVNKTMQN